MPAPEKRLFEELLDDSDSGPEIPDGFLHAVRSRRRAAARARAAWLGGLGAAAVIVLLAWFNPPGSVPTGPADEPPLRSGVVASAGVASDQSLGALQRDWETSGRLPILTQTRIGRAGADSLRFGDARLLVSGDG